MAVEMSLGTGDGVTGLAKPEGCTGDQIVWGGLLAVSAMGLGLLSRRVCEVRIEPEPDLDDAMLTSLSLRIRFDVAT